MDKRLENQAQWVKISPCRICAVLKKQRPTNISKWGSNPQAEPAKYLGLRLDSRLNWKQHVKQKAERIRSKKCQMYWLIGHCSKINFHYKTLIYQSTFKLIWTYGVQLWGCKCKSNQEVIQRSQNKFLKRITNTYQYVTNKEIRWRHSRIHQKHEKRLLNHINVEAIQLLDITNERKRLNLLEPHELYS